MQSPKNWRRFWTGWLALGAVGEAIALILGRGTLSVTSRGWFHTDTLVGRSIWAISWSLFSGLFMAHIMNKNDTFWE